MLWIIYLYVVVQLKLKKYFLSFYDYRVNIQKVSKLESYGYNRELFEGNNDIMPNVHEVNSQLLKK